MRVLLISGGSLLMQLLLLLLLLVVPATRGVLFPTNTVIQIVAAISWPIEIPDRKFFMNTGFQFNYNLANQTSTFLRPAFFPYDGRALLVASAAGQVANNSVQMTALDAATGGAGVDDVGDGASTMRRKPRHIVRTGSDIGNHKFGAGAPEHQSSNHFDALDVDKYRAAAATHRASHDGCDTQRCDNGGGEDHGDRDMSAGQLYRSFEDTLHDAGFHRSCMEKSVCQLARHPLHRDELNPSDPDGTDEDLLSEVLHFVLTPSEHRSFHQHEHLERGRYEAAEAVGRQGGDCDLEYSECAVTILDFVTNIDGAHEY